jgi:hypothetical protein
MQLIDLLAKARELSGSYENVVVSQNNDHVVRISRMTEPYSGISTLIPTKHSLDSTAFWFWR